jgi:sigma-B regulation protein RsbU (phosphoserine phosphatase)
MAYLHSHLRARAPIVNSLDELITRANRILVRESTRQRFVTFLALRIDPQARSLFYMRCGHPPGFIMNAAGEIATTMDGGSIPLGIVEDITFPEEGPIPLHHDDVVVMLTDGILEAESPQGIAFGMENTVSVIRQHRTQPAEEIIAALRESVCEHAGKTTFNDDITLVVAKVDAGQDSST